MTTEPIDAQILAALQARPMRRLEIEVLFGLGRKSTGWFLTKLRRRGAVRMVYVDDDCRPFYAVVQCAAGKPTTACSPGPRDRRPVHVDLSGAAFRSVFAGGVNPWAGCHGGTL